MMVSSLHIEGIQKSWDEMTSLVNWRRDHGHFDGRRTEQDRYWFREEVRQGLLAKLETPEVRAPMLSYGDQVSDGTMSSTIAAQKLLTELNS
jgi:LAO/AO transport system kinase